MKDGLRFVDSDMHVQEPGDLFEQYLDPSFKSRVTAPVNAKGNFQRYWTIDGIPSSMDGELQQYRKRGSKNVPQASGSTVTSVGQQLSASRSFGTGRLQFAIDRKYDNEAQLMAFPMEGIDIAVLFPTGCLSIMGRNNMDPSLSLALSQAYNNWMYDFSQRSPNQMKCCRSTMFPLHAKN